MRREKGKVKAKKSGISKVGLMDYGLRSRVRNYGAEDYK